MSHGLQRTAQNPGALGGVIGEMASGDHAGSYADPSQTGAAVDAGSGALGQIFGGPGVTSQIAPQISRVSGLDPGLISQLLPAVTSMALGGLAHAMQTQGHGDVLEPGAATQPAGGGGLFGSIVSAVEGALGGGSGGDMQSGLSSLINMFAPGVAAPAGPRAGAQRNPAEIARGRLHCFVAAPPLSRARRRRGGAWELAWRAM